MIEAVRMVLSGVARTEARFPCGKTLIAQMLCGSNSAKMTKLRLNQLSTFGLLWQLKQTEVVILIDGLIAFGMPGAGGPGSFSAGRSLTPLGDDVMRGKIELPAFARPGRTGAETPAAQSKGGRGKGDGREEKAEGGRRKAEGEESGGRRKAEGGGRQRQAFDLDGEAPARSPRRPPRWDPAAMDADMAWDMGADAGDMGLDMGVDRGHSTLTPATRSAFPLPRLPPSETSFSLRPSAPPGTNAGAKQLQRRCRNNPSRLQLGPGGLLATGFSMEECLAARGIKREVLLDHVIQAAESGWEIRAEWCLSAELLAAVKAVVGDGRPEQIRPLWRNCPPGRCTKRSRSS